MVLNMEAIKATMAIAAENNWMLFIRLGLSRTLRTPSTTFWLRKGRFPISRDKWSVKNGTTGISPTIAAVAREQAMIIPAKVLPRKGGTIAQAARSAIPTIHHLDFLPAFWPRS